MCATSIFLHISLKVFVVLTATAFKDNVFLPKHDRESPKSASDRGARFSPKARLQRELAQYVSQMDALRVHATLLADWSQPLQPLLSLSVVCISASPRRFPGGAVTGGLRSCGSDPEAPRATVNPALNSPASPPTVCSGCVSDTRD